MADRPILFSAPMVRALLSGRKTQTRRALNPQPYDFVTEGKRYWNASGSIGGRICISDGDLAGLHRWNVGDRLYVREEYYQRGHWEPVEGAMTKGGKQKWAFVPADDVILFDGPEIFRKGRHSADSATVAWHKRRGRFMPRAASRLTLAITDVRIERLNACSEADAIAEGIDEVTAEVAASDPSLRFWRRYRDGGWNGYVDTPIGSYASLWTEINGPGAWEANPWVAAVTFTIVTAAR